jgi:hypothetical protein
VLVYITALKMDFALNNMKEATALQRKTFASW